MLAPNLLTISEKRRVILSSVNNIIDCENLVEKLDAEQIAKYCGDTCSRFAGLIVESSVKTATQ